MRLGEAMQVCEMHGCTYPEGYTCPACQRTDEGVRRIFFKLLEVEKRLKMVECAQRGAGGSMKTGS